MVSVLKKSLVVGPVGPAPSFFGQARDAADPANNGRGQSIFVVPGCSKRAQNCWPLLWSALVGACPETPCGPGPSLGACHRAPFSRVRRGARCPSGRTPERTGRRSGLCAGGGVTVGILRGSRCFANRISSSLEQGVPPASTDWGTNFFPLGGVSPRG